MKRALQLLGGTVLGLALAEGMFRLADDGAFAHVNFYVPDAALGVRLEPGASQRIAFGGNPVTTARVNAEGYRGADWGPPQSGEVVVLGDSQVFGLGVEEDRTASAILAANLGRPVRNAGVPTYGPPEYLALLDELLAARKPETVVLVLNFSNDLFEKDTSNTQRHAVWDGWAVRLETAPARVTDFPGRKWLMSESHLVMAARRAWWTPPEAWEQGVASEGTWEAVVSAATQAPTAEAAEGAAARAPSPDECGEHVQMSEAQSRRCDALRAGAAAAGGADDSVAARVDRAAAQRLEVEDELLYLYRRVLVDDFHDESHLEVRAAVDHAHPGDIVADGYAEMSRVITVTAAHLREGARIRAELEGRLAKWAKENPTDERAREVRDALARRAALDAELGSLASADEEARGRSPLLDVVAAAKARCDAAGAELVVVALPLDVQVSDAEWDKYGVPRPEPGGPLDMAPTRALLADLVADTQRLGVRALDATVPLAAAQPGAFLNADLHMSPKGQAALGAALADVIRAPAPPRAGLPEGRSRVPTWAELALAPEVVVRGSTKNHCSTRRLREWLVVDCTRVYVAGDALPLGVVPVTGSEVLVGGAVHRTVLVAPLLPGHPIEADFVWSDRTERLTVAWEGETPRMAFTPTAARPAPARPACVEARSRDDFNLLWFGDLERGCAASYPADCDAQLACGAGTRTALPTCPEGQVSAGSAGHCHPLCDDARPCPTGTCTPWQGTGVCR